MPAQGTLTLHTGEKAVGQGRIKTQPVKFSIAGEGLNIGKDGAAGRGDRPRADAAVARQGLTAASGVDLGKRCFGWRAWQDSNLRPAA